VHQILALWCHPRSLSSAFERAMIERGDFHVCHEPFLYDYYVHRAKRQIPHFDIDPAHPVSYAEIKTGILRAAESRPVFIKDMSYYVLHELRRDAAFDALISDSFLIRDPARSIPSYYRLDAGVTSEEIGLTALQAHYQLSVERKSRRPFVFDAADLTADPVATMRGYCQAAGIEYLPESLHWAQRLPEEWKDVTGWHDAVLDSVGIRQSAPKAESEAQRLAGLQLAPQLAGYYAEHQPSYAAMRALRSLGD